jgi:hypothetical protein
MEFSELLSKSFNDEKDLLLQQFKEAIESKDYLKLQEISLSNKSKYKDELFLKMKDLYNFGKNTVASEIKVNPPVSPQEDLDRLMSQASIISDDHENRALVKAKIKAIDSIAKEIDANEAIKQIASIMIDSVVKLGQQTASIVAASALNQGRRMTQKANIADTYAFQRTELLDETTCDFCLSMDGRVVPAGDPWINEDEFHSNCRGMWVEIMKDEAELPDIDGVPEVVENKYEGVNDINTLRAPKIDKDSPAADLIKEEYTKEIASREKKIKEYEEDDIYPDRIAAHKKKIALMKQILNKLK